jgi:hypothetical protein
VDDLAVQLHAHFCAWSVALLVKESDAGGTAGGEHVSRPLFILGPVARPALAAIEDLIYARQVEGVGQGAEGWFVTDEANGGRNLTQVIGTAGVVGVLDTDA